MYKEVRVESVVKKHELVYADIACDHCLKKLKPMFEDEIHQDPETKEEFYTSLQIEDALILNAHGYYGGWFDDLCNWTGGESPKFIFCKECADLLKEAFPCFARLLHDYLTFPLS